MKLLTLAVLALVFTQNSYAHEGHTKAEHEPQEQTQAASNGAAAEEEEIVNKHDILDTHFLDRRPYQKVQ